MTTKNIVIKIPSEISERKVKLRIAANLYEEGEITLKQAADLVGISIWDILHEFGKIKTSFTNISFEDLQEELEDLG